MVISIGSVAVFTVCGGVALASMTKTVPEGLLTLGSAAVGGLAGALIPQRVAGGQNGGGTVE